MGARPPTPLPTGGGQSKERWLRWGQWRRPKPPQRLGKAKAAPAPRRLRAGEPGRGTRGGCAAWEPWRKGLGAAASAGAQTWGKGCWRVPEGCVRRARPLGRGEGACAPATHPRELGAAGAGPQDPAACTARPGAQQEPPAPARCGAGAAQVRWRRCSGAPSREAEPPRRGLCRARVLHCCSTRNGRTAPGPSGCVPQLWGRSLPQPEASGDAQQLKPRAPARLILQLPASVLFLHFFFLYVCHKIKPLQPRAACCVSPSTA